ncbi:MAG: hypothetical protein M0024_02095 [Nitrospiraceae bacterium]|nr:hypothetical protein [Nitrospiraceae bacterium]
MFWSFSFQLLPDENVIDDSTRMPQPAIKASYSVFLTNKRAIFRFDGLGSSMTQSFFYNEITNAAAIKRLFITYLDLKTAKKNVLLNISNAEYWADKIGEMKKSFEDPDVQATRPAQISPERRKRDLLDMLTVLHKNGLLTSEELEEKIHALDSMTI